MKPAPRSHGLLRLGRRQSESRPRWPTLISPSYHLVPTSTAMPRWTERLNTGPELHKGMASLEPRVSRVLPTRPPWRAHLAIPSARSTLFLSVRASNISARPKGCGCERRYSLSTKPRAGTIWIASNGRNRTGFGGPLRAALLPTSPPRHRDPQECHAETTTARRPNGVHSPSVRLSNTTAHRTGHGCKPRCWPFMRPRVVMT
mmetsp:Transcript_95526/g.270193  ORF Transcript_95526/g.270193 Transcript_95526/m.270193 type:complete len:203 (+) Transcript_95526:779-1387(+)